MRRFCLTFLLAVATLAFISLADNAPAAGPYNSPPGAGRSSYRAIRPEAVAQKGSVATRMSAAAVRIRGCRLPPYTVSLLVLGLERVTAH
jgi:hypothetical protein